MRPSISSVILSEERVEGPSNAEGKFDVGRSFDSFLAQDDRVFGRRLARTGRTLAFLLLCHLTLPLLARAHVPVPDSVLAPRTAPEAWNVLRLATNNVERLLAEDRLAEVPDQISLCSPALRALPGLAEPPDRCTPATERAVRALVAVASLAQMGVAGDRAGAAAGLEALRGSLRELAALFDPATVRADIFACPMHPDCLSADPAAPCPRCGMALVPRRVPYSFVFMTPGEPTLRLTARPDAPLQAGRAARVAVRLARPDGSPVLLPDLMVMHTQPIHLLIVDPALDDYHHEHPQLTGTPGEYAFTFTPARDTSYRIFADVVPNATGAQEYPFTDLPGTAQPEPISDRANRFSAEAEGCRLTLAFDAPPQARQTATLHITVEGPDGQPCTNLEPVMAAFAHLVGFYADGRTVVHLHPAGGEVLDERQRGGPTLDFKFYPPKAGFLRLYCQVQLGGRAVFAPFGVNVAP